MPWHSIADIPLMQNHTLLPQGMLHDTLSLEHLQKVELKVGEKPLHIA